ncbi:hypothetical protein [Nocardioides alkalitolerans]|uniref:hypothetical protein n=1 Tax=Nocardioides alkalitolerans TaxID=281714 RepID=UPI00040FB5BD|nr:hypothetical protein [Nocardioides alkalitolerans]
MRRLLGPVAAVVLLVGALAACDDADVASDGSGSGSDGGSGGGSSATDRYDDLVAERAAVRAAVPELLATLTDGVGGSVRFVQGRYQACESTLDASTSFLYSADATVDLDTTGPAALDAARPVLEAAGWSVAEPTQEAANRTRVEATRDGVTVGLTAYDDLAPLRVGATSACLPVAEEHRAGLGTDDEPFPPA